MIDKLPISYPALPLGAIEEGQPRSFPSTTSRRSAAAERDLQILKVMAAALITAILVLGFVLSSGGIGYEGHPGVGPDRPPQPVPAPAPAPAPVPDDVWMA